MAPAVNMAEMRMMKSLDTYSSFLSDMLKTGPVTLPVVRVTVTVEVRRERREVSAGMVRVGDGRVQIVVWCERVSSYMS